MDVDMGRQGHGSTDPWKTHRNRRESKVYISSPVQGRWEFKGTRTDPYPLVRLREKFLWVVEDWVVEIGQYIRTPNIMLEIKDLETF